MKFVRRAAALASLLSCAALTAYAAGAAKPAAAPARPAATPVVAPATPPPAAVTPASGEALDAVAAMVNDEAVLASDVEEQLMMFLQRSGAQPRQDELDTLRRQVLDVIIDDHLVQAEARRQGISVTETEVSRQLDVAMEDQRQRAGGEAQFQEALKREGLTEAQLRDRFRGDLQKQIAMEKLKQKLFPRKAVPVAEAVTYYTAHKDKFPKLPAELRLSVIQIPPQPESAAVAAGLARAMAARKRLAAGERFAKVAAEVSEDPGSANAGGDLGFFGRGRMEKSIEDVAYALRNNELSQPVRSVYGWHLIQAIERDTLRTAAGRDSLDAAGKPEVEVHARHILVRVTPTQADAARTHDLALRVRDEAAKGMNFATLVRRYSRYDGPSTPEGDVGFVSLGSLQPQIRAGLDSLEVGQVSELLPNQSGFNIFKVTDRRPEREYTIEEIRNDLPEAVGQAQFAEKYQAWVKTLRAKSQIEYRNY